MPNDEILKRIEQELNRRLDNLEEDRKLLVHRDVFDERTETLLGRIAIVDTNLKNLVSTITDMRDEATANRRLMLTQLVGVVVALGLFVLNLVVKIHGG